MKTMKNSDMSYTVVYSKSKKYLNMDNQAEKI